MLSFPLSDHITSLLACFQISSAKPSDAGTYVCLAQNALGTAQKRVEVIVDTGTVIPGAPQVQVEEIELTVEAGHTATLRCSATGVDRGGHTGQAEQRCPAAPTVDIRNLKLVSRPERLCRWHLPVMAEVPT